MEDCSTIFTRGEKYTILIFILEERRVAEAHKSRGYNQEQRPGKRQGASPEDAKMEYLRTRKENPV